MEFLREERTSLDEIQEFREVMKAVQALLHGYTCIPSKEFRESLSDLMAELGDAVGKFNRLTPSVKK